MNRKQYRQQCIDACPEDIKALIQQAIDRAFEHGRYVVAPMEPYYAARDQALVLIGALILNRQVELKQNGGGK